MPASEPQITAASEWGADKQGFVVELPSGRVARIKRSLDLSALLKQGRIPNPLNSIIMEMVRTKKQDFDIAKLDPDAMQQFMKLVDDIMCRCFVEPRCQQPPERLPGEDINAYQERADAWAPAEGSIHVEWVSEIDKMFVFAVAQGAATDLAPFREAESADVEAVGSVEDLEPETEHAVGPV